MSFLSTLKSKVKSGLEKKNNSELNLDYMTQTNILRPYIVFGDKYTKNIKTKNISQK